MSKVHIANLVEIRHWIVSDSSERDEGSWTTQLLFQNCNVDQSINYEGKTWRFLSFIYNGATRTRTGDNIESSLLVSTNQISMDYAYDIITVQDHIKRQIVVHTCLMNNDFTAVQKVLTTERWMGATMGYNEDAVEIGLASAIDAVFAGLPNMYLTERNVGRLPTTSRINTA